MIMSCECSFHISVKSFSFLLTLFKQKLKLNSSLQVFCQFDWIQWYSCNILCDFNHMLVSHGVIFSCVTWSYLFLCFVGPTFKISNFISKIFRKLNLANFGNPFLKIQINIFWQNVLQTSIINMKWFSNDMLNFWICYKLTDLFKFKSQNISKIYKLFIFQI